METIILYFVDFCTVQCFVRTTTFTFLITKLNKIFPLWNYKAMKSIRHPTNIEPSKSQQGN